MITSITRPVAPEPVADPRHGAADAARLRSDRIRRAVVWATTGVATSASLVGAGLILWSAFR